MWRSPTTENRYMDNGEYSLTKEEAKVLVVECLTTRWPGIQWRLREREVLDRAFGWVFGTEATSEDTPMEQCRRVPPGLVLVNQRSGTIRRLSHASDVAL